jgi:hypothetical protein
MANPRYVKTPDASDDDDDSSREADGTRIPLFAYSAYEGMGKKGKQRLLLTRIQTWDGKLQSPSGKEIVAILRDEGEILLEDFRAKFVESLAARAIGQKQYKLEKLKILFQDLWDKGALNSGDIEAIRGSIRDLKYIWLEGTKPENYTQDQLEHKKSLEDFEAWLTDTKMSYSKGNRFVAAASIKAALIASRGDVAAAARRLSRPEF